MDVSLRNDTTAALLTTVGLVLCVAAVVLTVAAQVQGNALLLPVALELAREADVRLWRRGNSIVLRC